jgi:outer membrane protein
MRNIRPIFSIIAAALCLSLFTQCCDEKHAGGASSIGRNIDLDSIGGIRVVYFDIDTVMYRYKFALDINKEMIGKENKIIATLNSKRRGIEEEVAQFEYRCNTRTFPNEQAFINERDEIMRKEQDYIKLRDELYSQLEKENQARGKELRDSIGNFIQEYNKIKGYDFILTKIGDNIFYANQTLDITQEIVDGLNRRYRSRMRP